MLGFAVTSEIGRGGETTAGKTGTARRRRGLFSSKQRRILAFADARAAASAVNVLI